MPSSPGKLLHAFRINNCHDYKDTPDFISAELLKLLGHIQACSIQMPNLHHYRFRWISHSKVGTKEETLLIFLCMVMTIHLICLGHTKHVGFHNKMIKGRVRPTRVPG
jgi:hypothetical protein